MDAHQRLIAVASGAGFASVVDAERLASDSNDAWRLGDVILRICWRGDPERIRREAAVLASLPPSVPHPELLDVGTTAALTWMVTRWLPGALAADVWPGLGRAGRERLLAEFAQALRSLHEWRPPATVAAAVGSRAGATTPEEITGQDINPLPVARALGIVGRAKENPYVDPALLDRLVERLHELSAFDLPSEAGDRVVVHGDAHLGNVIVSEGRLAALLDFEWVTPAPRDLELQALLRVDDDHAGFSVGSVARHYPEIVAHPRIVERLWLYDLAYCLRHLIVWPADAPPADLSPWYPLKRLATIVESPAYIERELART